MQYESLRTAENPRQPGGNEGHDPKVANNQRHARTDFMCNPPPRARLLACLTVLAFATVLSGAQFATPVLAQQGRPAAQQNADAPRGNAAPSGEAGARPARPQNENAVRLPADSTTEHAVELPGRTLRFKATAGSIPLNDAESGSLQAEVAFVAYVLGDANRPVTFLFNGGPGAASAYLNIGAVGPWRLPFENIS